MGSRRLQEPAGTCGRAPGCGQPPRSMVRTRAASGAAGEGLRPGRCSRQPARPPQLSQRNGEQHPSGAPFVSRPFQTQLQREREREGRHKGTAGADGAGAGGRRGCWEWWSLRASLGALPRGSAATAGELRMRAHFRLPWPRPLGAQLSSTRESGRRCRPRPHLLLVPIGRRGKSRQGIGCGRCQFCAGALFIPRWGRRGECSEPGGWWPRSVGSGPQGGGGGGGGLEARPAPACP